MKVKQPRASSFESVSTLVLYKNTPILPWVTIIEINTLTVPILPWVNIIRKLNHRTPNSSMGVNYPHYHLVIST